MTDLRQRLDEAILRFYESFEQPSWDELDPATERIQRRLQETGLLEDGRLQDTTDLNYDRAVWIAPAAERSPLPAFGFSAVGPFFCLTAPKPLEAPALAPEAAYLLERFLDVLDHPEFVPASLLGKRSPMMLPFVSMAGHPDREPLSYFAALFYESDIYNDPAEFPITDAEDDSTA